MFKVYTKIVINNFLEIIIINLINNLKCLLTKWEINQFK